MLVLCSIVHVELRQKINDNEVRIENTAAPFGVSFIKFLIDPHPPMSLQLASCKTHQTVKKTLIKREYENMKTVKKFAYPICNAICLPILVWFSNFNSQTPNMTQYYKYKP